MTKHALVFLCISLGAGCSSNGFSSSSGDGSGDGLMPDDVSDIPPGDAVGTSASGEYDLETYTTACLGSCPSLRVGLGLVSLCDVGEVSYPGVDVTQADGILALETFGLFPDRLDGALDANGAFTVGGAGTQHGAQVVLLATGTLHDDELVGTSDTRAYGDVDGQSFDCTTVAELTGTRADR